MFGFPAPSMGMTAAAGSTAAGCLPVQRVSQSVSQSPDRSGAFLVPHTHTPLTPLTGWLAGSMDMHGFLSTGGGGAVYLHACVCAHS